MTDKNHSARKHSKISPSGLKNLELCSAFERDNVETQAGHEGTQCHEAVEAFLLKKGFDAKMKDLSDYQKEMVAMVVEYISENFDLNQKFWVEEKLSMKFFEVEGFNRGIADAIFTHDEDEDTIILCDWKFGRNEVDDAEVNLQLHAYAVAAMRHLGKQKCIIHILQPSRYEISTAEISIKDENKIIKRVRLICQKAGEKPTPTPNDEACVWCKKLATCPAVSENALAASTEGTTLTPAVMSNLEKALADPEKASQIYSLASVLEKWSSSIKQRITKRVMEGYEIPGYKLVEKKGKRTCLDIVGCYQFLKANFGMTAERFLGNCSLSLSKLESDVALFAEKGNKTKAKEQISQELEANSFVVYGDPISYLMKSKKQ